MSQTDDIEIKLGGSGANAVIPMIKEGMTNILSEIHNQIYSQSSNPIFQSQQSTEEQLKKEATRLSRRKEVEKFLEIAGKSPDLYFESNIDTINHANQSRDVSAGRILAEQTESVASHNIGIALITGILLSYTIFSFRSVLFGSTGGIN